jgi:fluoride exporter
MNLLYIFIGGGLGSCLRYLIGKLINTYSSFAFPMGTLCANLLSCVLMVLVLRIGKDLNPTDPVRLMLIVGFLGGLSTFSTFSYETALLIKEGHLAMAFSNIGLSVSVCVYCLFRLT